MTPDERALLTRFLDDLGSSRALTKDGEADALITRTLAANPDAAYLLVQHAILSDQALHASQDRARELEAQLLQSQSQSAGSTFFSGGAFRGQTAVPPTTSPAGYAAQPGPTMWGPSGPGPFAGGGGLGSFLRTAGMTAAGVAGGEFLFSGLSNLFGARHGVGGGFGGQPLENVTINEFAGDSSPGGHGSGGLGGDSLSDLGAFSDGSWSGDDPGGDSGSGDY